MPESGGVKDSLGRVDRIALLVVGLEGFVYIQFCERDPCQQVHAAASAFSAKA